MAKRVRVKLNSPGVKALLNDKGVAEFLRSRAERVESAAEASAPVDTGTYRAAIHTEEVRTDRVTVRVVADADHALLVESRTGNLAKALDAAGG